MRNAIILHGQSATPDQLWYPWIKKRLEEKGWSVWVPQLPQADLPDLKRQLPFVLKNGFFTDETVIVGHSSGGTLILSILNKINIKIKRAILVAGFMTPLKEDNKYIIEKKYDVKKIGTNVEDLIFINSDNDPWGCDDKQGRIMFDKFGGTLIIRHGEGHMGSNAMKQPYKEFPLLLKLIDE